MKKLAIFMALMLVFTFAIAACTPAEETAVVETLTTEEEPMEEEPMEETLEGSTVTVFTPAGDEQARVFHDNFAAFEAETGIDVVVEITPDFASIVRVRCEAGDPHDIYNFPQPGLMATIADIGCLTDLNEFIDPADMQAQYAQSWIDMLTVDGAVYGLWHGVDIKSLVWYPKNDFEANGFSVPETWDELMTLTETIAGMGVTPWCIGIESGGATGWPATDWVEDIMLRTAGADAYDAWTSGELPFDSPEVRNAFEVMGEIWFNEDYVVGGTTGIQTIFFGDSPLGLFEPRTCYLHRQASFIPNFFPEGSVMGEDVDYFYLPPIDEAMGRPVLVSGNLVSLANDTPAGRAVMEFMMSAESVEAEVKAGNAIGPMEGVSLDWYPTDTQRGFAEILMNADVFRFDGSDLMPGAVGAGSFWTEVTSWVGGKDLGEALAAIDASWPE
jgi:alpha-glucoside transport system substrate-binding protein